jgi:hypothetical protein
LRSVEPTAALLRQAGWTINDKRVERIWQREGLKVPHKQPKRSGLWLADGSCIRLRPEQRNHVRCYDFVEDHTHDQRKYRMLNVLDEFSHSEGFDHYRHSYSEPLGARLSLADTNRTTSGG